MYCASCGTKNSEESKFCINCGHELTKINEKEIDTNTKINDKKVVVKSSGNGKALTSIILGVISFLFPLLPIPIIGLVLAIKSDERGSKTAGIILNIIGILYNFLVFILFVMIIGIMINESTNPSNYNYSTDYVEKTENKKYIGNSNYGYVLVPNEWIEFNDQNSGNAIQYSDIGEGGYIVTLNVIDKNVSCYEATKAIANGLKEEGATTSYTTAKIGRYNGYTINVTYDDGVYLQIYMFTTGGQKVHYVAIEGPDKENEYFNIPLTFTMNK